MYDYSQVNAMVDTHQHELIGLYYSYVHPSLPILEDRDAFDAAISSGTVPASLVAAVYCSAIRFWHLEPKLAKVEPLTRESLYKYIFSAVSLEARTPSLRTIQALLIYLQITPFHVREPNHPGFWALTSQVRQNRIPIHHPRPIMTR
jgi:hypothetical protein